MFKYTNTLELTLDGKMIFPGYFLNNFELLSFYLHFKENSLVAFNNFFKP